MQINYKNPELMIAGAVESKEIAWQSPSNIAIVKYWGKHGRQLPRNPSISLTLNAAHTKTEISYSEKQATDQPIDLEFYFEGQQNPAFASKVERFFSSILDIFPFLGQLKMVIHSSNSFPHSAGIASSASAMSALSLCLCSIEQELFGTLQEQAAFLSKASYVSRLGSGSACRSVYPVAAAWGHSAHLADSSDLFAVACEQHIHPIFKTFHDDILLINKEEKSVSSTAGHGLMEDNVYSAARYQQANDRFGALLQAMKTGDLEQFGTIAEQEALTLHALMMTSNPAYLLMTANSLKAIRLVQQYRKESGNPLYFTLDAGPNLHLLYPDTVAGEVSTFVKEVLQPLCQDGDVLSDVVGEGAVRYL